MNFVILLLRHATAVTFFSFLVLCDSTAPEGFVFPFVSNPEVPEVCDITVRYNDSMVVVFNLANTNAIDLALNCTSSVQDALDFEKNGGGQGALSQGPCEYPVMSKQPLHVLISILQTKTLVKCFGSLIGRILYCSKTSHSVASYSTMRPSRVVHGVLGGFFPGWIRILILPRFSIRLYSRSKHTTRRNQR